MNSGIFYGRCIDNENGYKRFITIGQIYKLKNNYDQGFYDVYGNNDRWTEGIFTRRFEIVSIEDYEYQQSELEIAPTQSKEIWKHHKDMWS